MTMYPFGVLIALGCLVASARHLNQPLSSYYDFVALSVVLGGTVAVAVITLPWEYWRDVLRGFFMLVFHRQRSKAAIVRAGLELVRSNGFSSNVDSRVDGLPGKILKDGAELIMLGISAERIEAILRERVYQTGKRAKRIAHALRSLAKYPPAFGLMGTVLGLVNLMRGIAAGLTAQQTGVEMAVALVATFYGLILANMLINPAGEMILKKASEDEEVAELALQAVILAADRSSLLESQELLNSFVSDEQRVDVIGNFTHDAEAA